MTSNVLSFPIPHTARIVPTSRTNPEISTAQTIDLMRAYSRQGALTPQVREATALALSLNRREPIDWSRERSNCERLWTWVRTHVTFREDETHLEGLGMPSKRAWDTELLITPQALLRMPNPTGDCDDFSMLLGSMLVCCGMLTCFVTVAADPTQPGVWSHVYVATYLSDGSRLALDASHGKYAGWEAPQSMRRKEWRV